MRPYIIPQRRSSGCGPTLARTAGTDVVGSGCPEALRPDGGDGEVQALTQPKDAEPCNLLRESGPSRELRLFEPYERAAGASTSGWRLARHAQVIADPRDRAVATIDATDESEAFVDDLEDHVAGVGQ